MRNYREKPIVGIVMGDPAGIGPEITIKAVGQPEIREVCLPIVIGDRGVVSRTLDSFGEGAGIKILREISRDSFEPERVNVLDTGNVDLKQITVGQASAAGGRAVFEDIQRAVELARDKKIHGFVAGPHNKYSVNLAGVHFAGYPPLVAKLTGSRYAFQHAHFRSDSHRGGDASRGPERCQQNANPGPGSGHDPGGG